MWDLETLKRLNAKEAERQKRLRLVREEMRRKNSSETFAGRIAQSQGLSDDEIFDMRYSDQNDRTGVDD